ncbi:DUF6200 domain-containing protein [aff. Roholtiella sp. LEGE 12411]|uniref:DUF6200 domain-containing protein n=1 Tax=aff. Roholtiella sp. LEGE 12411 TaxID=1828822 RepID=UPI001ABC3136|nr:hypothetical protein [aff. Roholtiella sp. LEGE 12411]
MNNPLEPLNNGQFGKIVVNCDEWTLSNGGFKQAPDTATFVTNIAKWFTGGRSKGKFHAYSTNFGLTESVLAETLTKAGYTWTVGNNIKIDLPTLLTFDGIFLCGDSADNQVLIDYVKAGGNVYLGAGTGSGGQQQEADRWNTFLNAFGFKLVGEYNGISGNQTINSSHPIFAGVKAIYFNNGNPIVDLDPASESNQIILTHANGQGLIAAFAGSERTVETQGVGGGSILATLVVGPKQSTTESEQTQTLKKYPKVEPKKPDLVISSKLPTSYPFRLVAFKATNGQYLVAENGGGGSLLANSFQNSIWETFKLITLENGKFALKAPLKEQYLSVHPDGNITWVDYIKEWEMLDLVELGDNKVALKGCHSKYISIQQGGAGIVLANGLGIKEGEILELIDLESRKSGQKEEKGKEIKLQEGRRKKANTIILEFGSQKKDLIRDFRQGRGRLFKKVTQAISELQKAGEIDNDVQPVIAIVRQKKSIKTLWD